MEITFHGRAAHAGMSPEEGRSAIQAAARAIGDLRLGRVDDETTANVGLISGGTAGNIVPDRCVFSAEARTHDERKLGELVQEMLDICTFAASEAECTMRERVHGRTIAATASRRTSRWSSSRRVRSRAAATRSRYGLSGGAAGANIFNERGLRCVNLTHGVYDFHSPNERVAVADLEAMVDVTVALVEDACA